MLTRQVRDCGSPSSSIRLPCRQKSLRLLDQQFSVWRRKVRIGSVFSPSALGLDIHELTVQFAWPLAGFAKVCSKALMTVA